MQRKNNNRRHWEEKVIVGKSPTSSPPLRPARTSKQRSDNLKALEELRMIVYPELRKGLRLDKSIEHVKRAKR